MTEKWGFLRETKKDAEKAGIDLDTGIHRTGLEEYLAVIYPNTQDWVHDKIIKNCGRRYRPDYRSEQEKLIVEFDGLPHYTDPQNILNDIEKTKFYQDMGYKVIRIPYFIQLTNKVIEQLFNRKVSQPMFNEKNSFSWGKREKYSCLSLWRRD